MIDRLWSLKFTSMFLIPGGGLSMFFDDEEKALKVFTDHTTALSGKPDDAMNILVFEDLTGRHCLRSSYFPYCLMYEIGPCDIAWMEIKKKCDDSQRAAGVVQNVGFQSGQETEKGETD